MLYRTPDKDHGLGFALHVGLHKEHFPSTRLNLFRNVAATGAVTIGKGHPCALFHEQPYRGFANARCTTGDRRHFAI